MMTSARLRRYHCFATTRVNTMLIDPNTRCAFIRNTSWAPSASFNMSRLA